MNTRCFVAASLEEVAAKIEDARTGEFAPALGFAFASVNFGIAPLCELLNKYEDIAFIGASTDGEIIAHGEGTVVHEGTAVISLLDCHRETFRTRLFQGDDLTSYEVGQEVGRWGAQQFTRPAFIITSAGLHVDGEKLLQGILSVTGPNATIFGGLAGDDEAFKTTFAFVSGRYTTNGVAALALNTDRIELGGVATSGWSGVGAEKRITKSEGNVLYTIDDQPVLEIYKKYLSINDDELPQTGVEYPLMLIREDGSTILRAVMDVNRDTGALIFAGTMPQGSRVKFSSSAGADVIAQVKKDLATYHHTFPEADHLILFSCLARHLAFGPMIDEEILAAYETWGVPLIGFFSYGEIGKDLNGKSDFFNETFTLATLKEKAK